MTTTTNTTANTTINVNNLKGAWNCEKNSLNAVIRWIFDTAKIKESKLPAAPDKSDKSTQAQELRNNIKTIKAQNKVIADCKYIVTALNITSVSNKDIVTLRSKIVANAPYVDTDNNIVKIVPAPKKLREACNNDSLYIVVAAAWIDAIIMTANNVDKIRVSGLTLTSAPKAKDGELIDNACGDIVDINGCKIDNMDNVLATWARVATATNTANAAGKVVSDAKYQECMLG